MSDTQNDKTPEQPTDPFAKSLGLPDEEMMTCEDGLYQNHHYRDFRGFEWSDFDAFRSFEQNILEYEGDIMEDEAAEEFAMDDNEVWMYDLDAGTATTVLALAAIGAVPITSCNGGADGAHHNEQHPLVLCWAEREHLDLILQAAARVGDAIKVVPEGASGILIYTARVDEAKPQKADVAPMMAFADALRAIAG